MSDAPELKCPKCGADLRLNRGGAFCSNEAECGLKVWRKTSEKELTDNQLARLVKGEKILVEGLKSKKTGKVFTAYLTYDPDTFKYLYDFEGLPQKSGSKGR